MMRSDRALLLIVCACFAAIVFGAAGISFVAWMRDIADVIAASA